MTILAIDEKAEMLGELADNLQAGIQQATSFLQEPCQWEDKFCGKGCLWEWCEHRKGKTSV